MIIKVRATQAGVHVALTFFIAPGPDRTFANVGALTCTDADADAILAVLLAYDELDGTAHTLIVDRWSP